MQPVKTEYILSLSYGKDSLACLRAIEHLGWPLDRIVTADVWATDDIPAEYPPVVAFKKYVDNYIKEHYGITVEHYCATRVDGIQKDKVTYNDGFYHVLQSGDHAGTIKGFPMQRGPWCQKLVVSVWRAAASLQGTERQPEPRQQQPRPVPEAAADGQAPQLVARRDPDLPDRRNVPLFRHGRQGSHPRGARHGQRRDPHLPRGRRPRQQPRDRQHRHRRGGHLRLRKGDRHGCIYQQ